jgi:hypothetical protein
MKNSQKNNFIWAFNAEDTHYFKLLVSFKDFKSGNAGEY